MKTARVYIATTEGPSQIQQVIEEDASIKSVICLDGTSEALEISRDYDGLVRKPTGLIERLYGHGAYRIDVSHRISAGRSWQLGVLYAHALHADGRLAMDGNDPDEVYWISGEVRHNLDVVAVDHIREKLRRSEGLLRKFAEAGTLTTLVVPEANLAELRDEAAELGLVNDHVQLIGLRRWEGLPGDAAVSVIRAPSRRARFGVVVLIAIVVAAAAFYAVKHGEALLTKVAPMTNPAAPPQIAQVRVTQAGTASSQDGPLAIGVAAIELRAPAGVTCGSIHFAGDSGVEKTLDADPSGLFPNRPASRLCGVDFRIHNISAQPQHLWAFLQSTPDLATPMQKDAIVLPDGEMAIDSGLKPWETEQGVNATLVIIAGDTAPTASGNALTISTDAAKLSDSLAALHRPYRIIRYSADPLVAPEYR